MQVISVTKKFGNFLALDSVSAEFEKGRVYVLAGPNGAGKTTLLRVIAGLIRPTSGNVDLASVSVLGAMMQESYLYRDMTPRENLELYADLYEVKRDRVDYVKEALQLDDFFDHDVETLSHGQKQRTALARALLPDPELLLLDEPFLGLDTSSISHLQKILTDYKKNGKTALIATHELELVREFADKLMLLDGGKIKYFGEFNV